LYVYKPLVLSDVFLGLDEKEFMFSGREYRGSMKKCITTGRLKYSAILYTYSIGGQYLSVLTIFRVPSSKRRRKENVDEYAAKVTKAISTIRKNSIAIFGRTDEG
jgi:hypothetical protein